MKNNRDIFSDINIAYIGDGSRGWAWTLMSDLANEPEMSGNVRLYDIDFQAAKNNEIIGNKYSQLDACVGKWNYIAVETIEEALAGADFVVISILPGTFKEMASDVHEPEVLKAFQNDSLVKAADLSKEQITTLMDTMLLNTKKYLPDRWKL